MNKVAIYARYSCEQQKNTSIDDQLRRCRELASNYGFGADDALVFEDSALSGTSKHQTKRGGYKALMDAWDGGQFSVLIVDEFSRLTRDGVEQAILVRRLEESARVRLLTTNGIDSQRPGWQMQIGLHGLVGQQSGRDTQHRVVRGMLGQLERGYMIATPAYGYSLFRQFDAAGNRIGTNWIINEDTATIVREIFNRRSHGQSMHEIARWLNESGVDTSREPTKESVGFWRASRIKAMLQNTIYRGVFVWNGSSNVRDKAKRRGTEVVEQLFHRPELRLVSDEVWYRCNENKISRSGYGGGKHALAGLVTCGCCASTLVLTAAGKNRRSLYCAKCTVTKLDVAHPSRDRLTSTVSTRGVELLLMEALKYFVTPEFIGSFKAALREKLVGNLPSEIAALETELSGYKRAQDRLSQMLKNDLEDETLVDRYREIRRSVLDTEYRLVALQQGAGLPDPALIEALVAVDPTALIGKLFTQNVPPELLRSHLARLFPEIVFEGKEDTHLSVFNIQFAPGAMLALAAGHEYSDGETHEQRFMLQFNPAQRWKSDSKGWTVSVMNSEAPSTGTDNAEVDTSDIEPNTFLLGLGHIEQTLVGA